MAQFIWLKDGKNWKETNDFEGNNVLKEWLGNNYFVRYKYDMINPDVKVSEEYVRDGKYYRPNGKPATVARTSSGLLVKETFYSGEDKVGDIRSKSYDLDGELSRITYVTSSKVGQLEQKQYYYNAYYPMQIHNFVTSSDTDNPHYRDEVRSEKWSLDGSKKLGVTYADGTSVSDYETGEREREVEYDNDGNRVTTSYNQNGDKKSFEIENTQTGVTESITYHDNGKIHQIMRVDGDLNDVTDKPAFEEYDESGKKITEDWFDESGKKIKSLN